MAGGTAGLAPAGGRASATAVGMIAVSRKIIGAVGRR